MAPLNPWGPQPSPSIWEFHPVDPQMHRCSSLQPCGHARSARVSLGSRNRCPKSAVPRWPRAEAWRRMGWPRTHWCQKAPFPSAIPRWSRLCPGTSTNLPSFLGTPNQWGSWAPPPATDTIWEVTELSRRPSPGCPTSCPSCSWRSSCLCPSPSCSSSSCSSTSCRCRSSR